MKIVRLPAARHCAMSYFEELGDEFDDATGIIDDALHAAMSPAGNFDSLVMERYLTTVGYSHGVVGQDSAFPSVAMLHSTGHMFDWHGLESACEAYWNGYEDGLRDMDALHDQEMNAFMHDLCDDISEKFTRYKFLRASMGEKHAMLYYLRSAVAFMSK